MSKDNFKYIENYNAEEATMRLFGVIGGFDGVNGTTFANELQWLENQCKKVNILINSEGGSVLDGYSIYAAITNSSCETQAKISGLAASTASWCAMACNKVVMEDYSTLMIHGVTDTSKNPNKDLENMINGSIATIMSNRTGMSIEECNDLMNKETYYKAFDKKDRETLINKKIVDEIITTDKKVKSPKVMNIKNLVNLYNSLNTENKPKMKNIANKLNVSENASEEVIVSEIEKLQNQLTELTNKNTELDTKVKAFETEKANAEEAAKIALKNKATALADKLESEKKIKAEEKASVIENASKDEASYEFVKNTFDKITTGKAPMNIANDAKIGTGESKDERKNWNYTDWSKKDPSGLEKMMNEEPERFNELLKTLNIK